MLEFKRDWKKKAPQQAAKRITKKRTTGNEAMRQWGKRVGSLLTIRQPINHNTRLPKLSFSCDIA
jgi:hypothetical protein